MEGDSPGFFYLQGHRSDCSVWGAEWEERVPLLEGRREKRKLVIYFSFCEIDVEKASNAQFICTYLLKNCRYVKGETVQLKKYCLEGH